jgi:hypothetical protein
MYLIVANGANGFKILYIELTAIVIVLIHNNKLKEFIIVVIEILSLILRIYIYARVAVVIFIISPFILSSWLKINDNKIYKKRKNNKTLSTVIMILST